MDAEKATEQVLSNSVIPPQERNPSGKGGFGDNPQNRNPGGWKKDFSISYQYNRFLRMSADEFAKFTSDIEVNPGAYKMAEVLAYKRVAEARQSLPDMKEITDRTEGKAQQAVDITSAGNELQPVLVRFVGDDLGNTDTDGV